MMTEEQRAKYREMELISEELDANRCRSANVLSVLKRDEFGAPWLGMHIVSIGSQTMKNKIMEVVAKYPQFKLINEKTSSLLYVFEM